MLSNKAHRVRDAFRSREGMVKFLEAPAPVGEEYVSSTGTRVSIPTDTTDGSGLISI